MSTRLTPEDREQIQRFVAKPRHERDPNDLVPRVDESEDVSTG